MLKRAYTNNLIEAGCDEAGRGCLAGPVVAAAVILPADPIAIGFNISGIDDSKKLTEKKRMILEPLIKEMAVSYAIGVVDNLEIDRINILQASFLAMHRAILKLDVQPELLLIDGNRFKPFPDVNHHCIIKGDAKFLSIAAASILAKVERDRLMTSLHQKYPQFDWCKNKGYPTKVHRNAIFQFGPSPLHRKTFTLLSALQTKLLR